MPFIHQAMAILASVIIAFIVQFMVVLFYNHSPFINLIMNLPVLDYLQFIQQAMIWLVVHAVTFLLDSRNLTAIALVMVHVFHWKPSIMWRLLPSSTRALFIHLDRRTLTKGYFRTTLSIIISHDILHRIRDTQDLYSSLIRCYASLRSLHY